MAQYFSIHPDSPQVRLLREAAAIIRAGGIAAYPTDSCYALGCGIGQAEALARVRQLRKLDGKRQMTLICRDLSEIAVYARVPDAAFRMMKSLTPGPYTFYCRRRVTSRSACCSLKRTIGIRIPANPVTLALLDQLAEPLTSTSLVLPGEDLPETAPEEIEAKLGRQLEVVLDGGAGGLEFTTVIDLTGAEPAVVRPGLGLEALERYSV